MIQKAIGSFFGDFWEAYNAPTRQGRLESQLELERRQAIAKQLYEQSFRDTAAELEKQRKTAEAYAKNPEQFNSQINPVPSWNEADQLALYDAYQRSGIDREKQAESDQAVLAADAFKRGLANITNDAALVNIGMGKEYKPVELEGGVFYNPYDTQNFNLGSTQKHQAETKLEQSEAAEQALRLANIRALKDPLMQINATSNKELGKPIEAEVEGPNGETHKALITQDSSGGYHHATVTDKAGNPLVIPPEAVGGGNSGLTTDQKNVKYYAQLWGITEAEAAEILKSKSQFSDAGFLEDRLIKNAQGPYGNRNSDKKILTATFDDFVRARYGSSFPEHFIDEINRSTTMKPAEKEALIQQIEDYNFKVFEMGLAGQQTPEPTVTPTVQPAVQPAVTTAVTNAAPPVTPVPVQPQPAMPAPDIAPAPALMPEPQPAAPVPIPEPPPAPDFMAFAEAVMTNDSPAQINAALKKQGFDLSPQAMGALAIDAINQGVSVQDIQQLYQLLGIQWTPPA